MRSPRAGRVAKGTSPRVGGKPQSKVNIKSLLVWGFWTWNVRPTTTPRWSKKDAAVMALKEATRRYFDDACEVGCYVFSCGAGCWQCYVKYYNFIFLEQESCCSKWEQVEEGCIDRKEQLHLCWERHCDQVTEGGKPQRGFHCPWLRQFQAGYYVKLHRGDHARNCQQNVAQDTELHDPHCFNSK